MRATTETSFAEQISVAAATLSGPYELHSLDRAFSALEVLGKSELPLSLTEICCAMRLHKSTAHRTLMVLERWGLIERTSGNRFRLGMKLYELGIRAVDQSDLRSRTHSISRKLSLELGETVHLGVLQGSSVVYLDKVDPSHRFRMACRVGISNPAYCTSMGKAILAFQPAGRAAQSIAKYRFAPYTPRTLRSPEALLRSLAGVRRRGYAIDDEEIESGIRCIGAPILDENGLPIAAVSVSGPAARITSQTLPEIALRLLHCCAEIADAVKNRTGAAAKPGPEPPVSAAPKPKRPATRSYALPVRSSHPAQADCEQR